MTTFFDRWNEYARSVAARLGPVVAKYGWDADDARQTASMKLLKVASNDRVVAMTDECLKKYLPVLIRRVILRLATGQRSLLVSAEAQVAALADDKGASAVAEMLSDALADAPPSIRAYFDEVVVRGREFTGAKRVRHAAARWVAGRMK